MGITTKHLSIAQVLAIQQMSSDSAGPRTRPFNYPDNKTSRPCIDLKAMDSRPCLGHILQSPCPIVGWATLPGRLAQTLYSSVGCDLHDLYRYGTELVKYKYKYLFV